MDEDDIVFVHPKYSSLSNPSEQESRVGVGSSGLSLQELVVAISEILNNPSYDPKNPDCVSKVKQLMESYDTSSNDHKRFEFWDEQKNYTRNLIATDNSTFTLMLLCWNPLKASPIHAHANSNCWMNIISGTCRETRYAWPTCEDDPLEQIGQTDLTAGKVAFICDELGLHKIENPSDKQGAISLHLYSPPYESCLIFRDPSCGRSVESFSTFYSEYGAKVEFH